MQESCKNRARLCKKRDISGASLACKILACKILARFLHDLASSFLLGKGGYSNQPSYLGGGAGGAGVDPGFSEGGG